MRSLRGIAAVDQILLALPELVREQHITRAEYLTDCMRWLWVKVELLRRLNDHERARYCKKLIDEMLADPCFYPEKEHA